MTAFHFPGLIALGTFDHVEHDMPGSGWVTVHFTNGCCAVVDNSAGGTLEAIWPPTAGATASSAIADTLAERQRQQNALGWTPEHDDAHHDGDDALARAAACYALAGAGGNGPFWISHLLTPQQVWPYRWEWKPKDRRTNLVRAAALLIAEIERLDRSSAAA